MGSKGRCKNRSYMIAGVKVGSGEAKTEGGRSIVLGRDAGEGEINLNDITEPCWATVTTQDGKTLRLWFEPANRYGEAGRKTFDPWKLDTPEDRDRYIALAASRMALGAGESSDYAEKVLREAGKHTGPYTGETLLRRATQLLDLAYQQRNENHAAELIAAYSGEDRIQESRIAELVTTMHQQDALLHLVEHALSEVVTAAARDRLQEITRLGEESLRQARAAAEILAQTPPPPGRGKKRGRKRTETRLSDEERATIVDHAETMSGTLSAALSPYGIDSGDAVALLTRIAKSPQKRVWLAKVLMSGDTDAGTLRAVAEADSEKDALARAGIPEHVLERNGDLDDAEERRMNTPPNLRRDPTYLRGRAVIRMLCRDREERVLRQLVAALHNRPGSSSIEDAEAIVENLENAVLVYQLLCSELPFSPAHEQALSLHPRDRSRLRALADGRWRPESDLLTESTNLLRAVRNAALAARGLRREQEAAMASAKTYRNLKRVAELEQELLPELSKGLLDLAGIRTGGAPRRRR